MEFWQIIVLIIVAIMGGIVLKVTLSFDVNRWLESRRAHQKENLQTICPHSYLRKTPGGDLRIDSHFNSPVGTVYWMCNQCGFWTMDPSLPGEFIDHWASGPRDLVERQEKFEKLARKLGMI